MLDLLAVSQAFLYWVPAEDTDVTFFEKLYMANQAVADKCLWILIYLKKSVKILQWYGLLAGNN